MPATSEVMTSSWAIWPESSGRDVSLPNLVENMLDGWRFYPESEWTAYGYRPPEGAIVHGAWRTAAADAFAFFVRSELQQGSQGPHALLYVTAPEHLLSTLDQKIKQLKANVQSAEEKKQREARIQSRTKASGKANPTSNLIKLISIFTVIVNGLSLYLRKLPVPNIPVASLSMFYSVLLAIVHISALLLLLFLIVLSIAYVVRYGAIIIKSIK